MMYFKRKGGRHQYPEKVGNMEKHYRTMRWVVLVCMAFQAAINEGMKVT
jgi:hypothetical protein